MPKQIDIAAFAEAYAAGAPVVDVREPYEYEQAHLPGAKLIPLAEIPARATEIDPDTTTYVLCAAGIRSLRAVEALEAAGYDVVNVEGGMNEWAAEGRPYEQGPVQG
ncbi:Rhodanese-related sulfurtransferase [Raineyella antarctica]|uniref:Rhodanese-related sulfurtransferase n=1 Tax=Raineyella antarctica TaxID=1577474 RepID=A0A1G6GEG2_9ACTN|nr:rhodanese-like domain-containing protein [Raineyella antarctica]SDB80354.1 Rhodanese-related sulfurtransferase [Raineyella antarctica]